MLNHGIRGLLFHYKKKLLFCNIGFYFLLFGKSIQKHPDSVCENDVNKEQNVRRYYMTNHWTRGWFFYCKKKVYYFGFYFLVRVSKTSWFSFIRRYSPCCKPVKLGHYSVLRPGILGLLLTFMVKWRKSGIINNINLMHLIISRRGFTWRLFWRLLTWPFCQYRVHVSSNAKSLYLKQYPMFCSFV